MEVGAVNDVTNFCECAFTIVIAQFGDSYHGLTYFLECVSFLGVEGESREGKGQSLFIGHLVVTCADNVSPFVW